VTARPTESVTVRAPSKVNLCLAVGPRRPDGYHDLENVFCALSLADELTASPSDGLTVRVSGQGADDVPADDSNLAVRAARALAERAGVPARAHLDIRKDIPVAGGMAGGSADAAAALVACDTLWGTGVGPEVLHELAAGLGSDVPFALLGGVAVGTGRGEVLAPLPDLASVFSWVLALAGEGLSTPAVYGELDRQRADADVPAPQGRGDAVLDAVRAGDPERLGRALVNDLQPAALALRPSLRGPLEVGIVLGALGAVVSGSGPTVALLARDPVHAEALAARLAREGVCSAVRTATGPASGAAVLPKAGP
jgi:4-diphosphocytidyl-2-C-methyl-D-erythritol kinase